MTQLMELLADPVRSRIYFEVLRRGETTAQQLMQYVKVNRSTLTHHLTKFVEANILLVRVEALGRPVKYYRINEALEVQVVIDGSQETIELLQQRIAFLESAVAHMQMITNLAREAAHRRRSELEHRTKAGEPIEPPLKRKELVGFTFLFLGDQSARIWEREYTKFLATVEKKLKANRGRSRRSTPTQHIAFAGLLPWLQDLSEGD